MSLGKSFFFYYVNLLTTEKYFLFSITLVILGCNTIKILVVTTIPVRKMVCIQPI
jgi:hypothetical protein